MANTEISIPTLYGGVSRQAPSIRHANQVEEANNVLFSVEHGMSKRPGSEMVFAVSALTASADYKLHVIHRDETEKYLIVIGQGIVRAFDTSGTEFQILMSEDAAAYLLANSPTVAQLRAVTIADYTILLNTTVETGWLDQPVYKVDTEHKHWHHLRAHTNPAGDYDRTLEDDEGITAGYWKYVPGGGTFATISFDKSGGVSGDFANFDKYNKDAWNPGGFKANFSRLALSVAATIAWDPVEHTLTQSDTFKNYEWRAGDQIKITAGTDTDAGWYEILSKENDSTIVIKTDDVELSLGFTGGNMSTSARTDLDAENIGIHAIATLHFWERTIADMWDVAAAFQAEFQKTKGLEDVLVDWDFTDETAGFFSITSPWKGQNATMLATESPDSGYDFTNPANRPFSRTGADYTITAGSGTPLNDYLEPEDRWIRVAAPGQIEALLDPAKMPIQMVRDFPPVDSYRDNIMAEGRFGYWRLGDLAQATGNGLTGLYYDNVDFTGYLYTQIDTTIEFTWTGTAPSASHTNNDYYSERWTGFINPDHTETYTFFVNCDDGARLWVNDVLVIDEWHDHAPTEYSGTIALTQDAKVSVRLDHYQGPIAQSVIELRWQSTSQNGGVKQVIPQANLFSSAAAGTDAKDETGRNDGTYTNTPTLGTTGAISNDADTAVTFDGVDQYVSVGLLVPFGAQLSTGITLEAWIYPTSTSPDAMMGSRDLTGGSNQEIYFGIPSDGKLEFLITDNNDLTAQFRVDTPTISINTWTHVVVTWHPDTPNDCQMYINGEAKATTRVSSAHTGKFSFIDLTIAFFIGAENLDGAAVDATTAWSGALDEVIIYSRVITPTTVLKHYLSGTGSTDAFFRIDTIDWTGRFSGDHATNPLPSIIEHEKTISDIGFHRNRLAIVGDENVVYSQAGDFFNFFIASASDIGDADPIDAALTASKVTIVDHIVTFGKRQVIFTKSGQQFETNDPIAFTIDTAAITPSTAYKSIIGVRPVPIDNFLYFASKEEGSSQLMEYFYIEEETSHKAVDTTKHCPGYLPSDVQTLAVCLNESTVLLIEPDGNTVYVYRYYWDAGKKIMASWAKYTFDSTERIVDMGVIDNDCYLLIEDGNNAYYVTSFAIPGDVATSTWEYLVHLDNRVTATGVYSDPTTTWTLTVSDETLDTAVLGPAFGDDSGEQIALTMVSGTSYTATGDYSAGVSQLGRIFTMNVELSRPYVRGRNGEAKLNMSLQLLKLVTNHINTGQYIIRINQVGRAVRDQTFTPLDGSILDAEGNAQAWIQGRADDTTISIVDESALPTIISAASYAATFTQRNR